MGSNASTFGHRSVRHWYRSKPPVYGSTEEWAFATAIGSEDGWRRHRLAPRRFHRGLLIVPGRFSLRFRGGHNHVASGRHDIVGSVTTAALLGSDSGNPCVGEVGHTGAQGRPESGRGNNNPVASRPRSMERNLSRHRIPDDGIRRQSVHLLQSRHQRKLRISEGAGHSNILIESRWPAHVPRDNRAPPRCRNCQGARRTQWVGYGDGDGHVYGDRLTVLSA
jgi:hypothetical protein